MQIYKSKKQHIRKLETPNLRQQIQDNKQVRAVGFRNYHVKGLFDHDNKISRGTHQKV